MVCLLLLHGIPQTHVLWRKVAPTLMRDYFVVMTDLLHQNITKEFATIFYHWFLVAQPAPFPETLLEEQRRIFSKMDLAVARRQPIDGPASRLDQPRHIPGVFTEVSLSFQRA